MNTQNKTTKPFILASASPRRKHLLEKAGYDFEIIPSDVDESVFETENVDTCKYAMDLALAKANDITEKHPVRLVVGADTIVDFDGLIIGKPDDAQHAEQITRMLFSSPHLVITGLAFVCIEREIKITRADTTTVYPREMTPQQLDEHIKGETWQGKAGAYAIQETGDQFVDRIEGSFTNVIGLPMELFEEIISTIQ